MARTVQDADLRFWEAFASSGDWGLPDHARLMFQCLSEPGQRARVLVREVDRSAVEQELLVVSDADLLALLGQAHELD